MHQILLNIFVALQISIDTMDSFNNLKNFYKNKNKKFIIKNIKTFFEKS